LNIPQNSITSLIGPNGAGKTSAFNCLTGFYKASGGGISFLGRNILRKKPHKITQMGMARTFQNLQAFQEHVGYGKRDERSALPQPYAGVFGRGHPAPGQQAEEKQPGYMSIASAWSSWVFLIWQTASPATCPMATSAGWSGPGPWPPSPS
jgi:hypothetical protein